MKTVELTVALQIEVSDDTDVSEIFCLDIFNPEESIRLETYDGTFLDGACVVGYETLDIQETTVEEEEPDYAKELAEADAEFAAVWKELVRDCEG